jgi:hypothetical protein
MHDAFELAYPDGFESAPDLPASTPDPVADILAALREDQSTLADEIARAIEAVGDDADDAALAVAVTHVLMLHREALETMLQGAHLAAALEGMRRMLDAVPASPEMTAAAALASASAASAAPTQGIAAPDSLAGSRLLPLVDEAARYLVQQGLASAQQVEQAGADARDAARSVADNALRDTHAVVNRALIEAVRTGGTKEKFAATVRQQLAGHGDSYLSDSAVENRFRTGVMSAYSNGQMRLVEGNPFARALFPYAAFHATHDDRVRHDHLLLETTGLDGTSVYRLDDPTFIKYRPPVFFNCRCVWAPLSIEGAAKLGVKEAQEWLRTGTPPASPEWVTPPKDPPVTFAEAGYTLAGDGFEVAAVDGFEFGWVADQNYKGTVGKWIGTGPDAGKKPRYQRTQPGLRKPAVPGAPGAEKTPGGQPATPGGKRKTPAAPRGKQPPAGAQKPPTKRQQAAADYQQRATNAASLLERVGKGEVDAGAGWVRNAVASAMSKASVAQLQELGKEAGIKLPRLKSKAAEALTDHALKTATEKAQATKQAAHDASPQGEEAAALRKILGMKLKPGDYTIGSGEFAGRKVRVGNGTAGFLKQQGQADKPDTPQRQAAAKVAAAVQGDHQSASLVKKLATLDSGPQKEFAQRLDKHKAYLKIAQDNLRKAQPGTPLWRQALGQLQQMNAALPQLQKELDESQRRQAEQTRKLLAVGSPSRLGMQHQASATAEVRRQADHAAEWLGSITRGVKADVRVEGGGHEGRSYYADGAVNLGADSHNAIAVHEIGHHLEAMPHIRAACHAFLEHRHGDEPYRELNEVTSGGYAPGEKGRKDNFDKVFGPRSAYYVGKTYKNGATELLSMGIQALYENPAKLAQQDPELCRFIVGVLHGRIKG